MIRWEKHEKVADSKVSLLKEELQVDTMIAELLMQRGVENFEQAKKFFRPSLEQLYDPFLMKGMQKAVLRIQKAIDVQEKILIYGDYDVDGTTAVALVSSYFRDHFDVHIQTYIPDRYDEGYGISFKGIDFAKENNFTLIIALDCGIKAVDKIAYANEKNIDFIICDHHLPGENVPEAVAVLDPKQPDCSYPFKELCGCGVGFKLIQAFHRFQEKNEEEIYNYLDLVAVATAADIVPIVDENRILAFYGLKRINENPCVGIRSLFGEQIRCAKISDLVFKLAPKINAAGRIKHGNYAVELLAAKDETFAIEAAKEIITWNDERKTLDETITAEALLQIEEAKETQRASTVVYSPHWHKGVIGIVASRLIETHYKPTLVFTKSGEYLAASARSVVGYNVYEALEKCQDYLLQFGGHKYAAGLTLLPEQYESFKQKFEEVVQETLPESLKIPRIVVDAVIDFDELTSKNLRILSQFEPHGPGNMSPVFCTKDVFDTGFAQLIGKDQEHLRLYLKQKNSQAFPAIQFKAAERMSDFKNFNLNHIVYTVNENEFKGKTTWQLMLKDTKPAII